MEYAELFQKALKGRTVNQAAKDWGIPQSTLDAYSKGKRVPDYQAAMILASEAGITPGDVMMIMVRLEASKKPRSLFPEMGFATAAIMTAVTLFLTPPPTQAQGKPVSLMEQVIVMSNAIRRWIKAAYARIASTARATAR